MKVKLKLLFIVTCFGGSAFAKIGDTETKWLTRFPGTRLVARDTYKGHKRMAVQFPDGGQVVGVFVDNSCEFQTSLTPRTKSREPSSSDVEKVAGQYGGHLDSWAFLSPNENYKQWVRPDRQLEIVVQKNPDGRWSLSTIAGALLAEMTGSSSANEAQNSAPVPDRGLQPTLDMPELATMAEPTATPTPEPTSTPEPVATPKPTVAPIVADCPADDGGKDKAPFVFKGFYLGMQLGCAVKLINEKYSDVFGQVAIKDIDQDVGVGFGPMSYRQMVAMAGRKNAEKVAYLVVASKGSLGPNPVIEADAQKKVIGFRFTSDINDALFNSKELDAKTFALEFGKAYHCTTFGVAVVMEPFRTEDSLGQVRQGWKYDGYDGVHIEITTDKGLEIESVPSSSERKFD